MNLLRNKKCRWLLPIFLLTWVTAHAETPEERGARALDEARRSPMEMRFQALDGREVDLEKLRGKVVLIDFWAATWCGACKVELPKLKAAYAKYHDRGFEVVGIACEMKESDRAFLTDYVKNQGITWPQYFDGKGLLDNKYAQRYGFPGIPQYMLLDKNGLMVSHTEGSGGLDGLDELVRQHLGLNPQP